VNKSTIEVYERGGVLLQSIPFAPSEDLCSTLRRDYYNTYEFAIPTACDPGLHTLKLIVEDRLSGKKATCSLDFTVK
jgi:hypothetical protein